MSSAAGAARRRAKVGHKKSRNGCQKCKSRRVKCDERHPVCTPCERLDLECSWIGSGPGSSRHDHLDLSDGTVAAEAGASSASSARSHLALSPSLSPLAGALTPATSNPRGLSSEPSSVEDVQGRQHLQGTAAFSMQSPDSRRYRELNRLLATRTGEEQTLFAFVDDHQNLELPESRARRILEHRLMQNYLLNLTNPFPVAPSEDWTSLWGRRMPELALKYDNLMYILMAHSASHLLRTEPDNAELINARQSYFMLAVREQRKMVDYLSPETADAICFASLLLSTASFYMLSERTPDPYTAPIAWLQMGRGAGVVFWMTLNMLRESDEDAAKLMPSASIISNSHPRFTDIDSFFIPELRANFEGILTQKIPSEDDWEDIETREAYEKALSYIGSVQRAIDHGEPVYSICRRIQAFALLVEPKLTQFIGEMRPRALVVLATFWATVAQVHGVWWLGGDAEGRESVAVREIRAIRKIVPEDWQGMMTWPLDMAGLR